ncbi:putative leucine-rich repeat-containing protein DDB_G0290503 isoform X4 [Bolinopsis microptera]|uniref:putative leucine-rich repeat-containing protein DDB_G0290503 isoform X4 n=1 Tax=Bolinopsis microptera TaxID=2820187 RepID=UPI003079A875
MPADRDRSMIDELRQKVVDLTEQLGQERVKVKQVHHDKVIEVRHAREQEQVKCEKEKITLKKKYLKEKNDAVNKILENLKKKDRGIGEVLNQKDDEIRVLQAELQVLQTENDSGSHTSLTNEQESAYISELRDQFETEKARLMQSMFELRTEKVRLEEELDIIKDSDREKAIQLRQMHDQHQRELSKIKRSSTVENRKQLDELRQVERRVMDKEKELSRKSKRMSQIEVTKEELQEKLNEQKLSERINLSMSMIDLNSSFSPQHTPPVIKPRGSARSASGNLARSSSSTFSYGRLSRTSSSSSVSSARKSHATTPSSPNAGARPPSFGPVRVERKSQEEREKGFQQRNTELQARIKQLEEKINSLNSENESLVGKMFQERKTRVQLENNLNDQLQKTSNSNSSSTQPKKQSGGQDGKKRRVSLSTICANLEEKNKELSKQNQDLLTQLDELKESAELSVDGKALAEKLRIQEKEKLLVERTLAQILTQSNIKLPKDIRLSSKENIENQALQMELNEAWQNDDNDSQDAQLVEELRAKILEQEQDYKKMVTDTKQKEEELESSNVQLSKELSALKANQVQLAEQLNSTKAVMKNLKAENEQFKQSTARIQSEYEQLQQSSALLEAEIEKLKQAPAKPVPDLDKQLREARDLKNEIEMLRAEKQKLLDGEASSKQKIKLLEEVQMELVKKEEKNSRYYDDITQRRYEAEEMASMLNDRNEYLEQLEKSIMQIKDDKDKEYLRKECENYRLSNLKLESRLSKMESKLSPNSAALINKITELEETTEVVEALKVSNEDLKNHIRQYEAEKGAMKKQHNEELQRVIRTLDKKNKEHNQKSEELRSHIKRLESDLRHLETSKMENSGNLQIKSQELQQMSEYVRKLETTENDLRTKLELYQKTTQEELEGLKERNRELELNTKKMTDMRQTERVLRRHIIEIDKARASEARQHHRAKLQLEDLKKKAESTETQLAKTKEVDSLIQEVVMLQASEQRLKSQLEDIRSGKDLNQTMITESKSKDDELHKLYDQIKDLNKKLDGSTNVFEEKSRLAEQLEKQETEYRNVTKSLRAEVAKLEVQLQEREKQALEFKQLVSRLEQEIKEISDDQEKRVLLEKIVHLEGDLSSTKSENTKLSTQMDNVAKGSMAAVKSVEFTDGAFAEVHSAIVTKIKEQGDELNSLMKNLRALLNSSIQSSGNQMSEEQQQKYLLFMQNLETIGFIVKETMSLDQLLENLEKIYSRDLQGLENNKIEALSKVEDLKASIVELKLTEVDNEFSTYPAALSLELRHLNNKLALTEEENRSIKMEYKDMRDQLQLKRDQAILLETRLNDSEHKLAGRSNRSNEIRSQATVDQADARHKSVKNKLSSEISMLESSLATAHSTIKTLQAQLPEGASDSILIKQVQETQEKMLAMQAEYRKQIDNLEVNLSTTNATLLRRENEIKMLREGVSHLESRLERAALAKEQDMAAVKLEKEKHILANQKLETQNIELVTLCETIKGDFEKQSLTTKELEDLKNKLQHDLELNQQEAKMSRDKVKVLEDKLASLRDEAASHSSPDALLQSKEEQINDLEEKLNEQSEKSQGEISSLKSQIWQLQTDVSSERAAKKAVDARLSELKLKLETSNSSYEKELETSKENMNSYRMKYNELAQSTKEMNEISDDLTKKVRQLEFEVESKTNEIRDLREHCNELDKTVKQRNLEIERLIKKTEELDKELSVRRNATDVNGELSELLLNKDNHIQEIEVKLQKSVGEVIAAKSEVAELKKKIGTLEERRRNQTEESKKLQNEAERESKKDRELLHEKNNTLNREITRLTAMLSQNIGQENNAPVDNTVLDRMTKMETELNEVSKKYRGSASVLEEKQEELKVQKDEIKLLRMTVESYDSKVNEQTDLINKLQKELTNVKGTLAVSLLDEIQQATASLPPQLEKVPSIMLGDDDVSNALRTIDEANSTSTLQRTATAESEARYYVALSDYEAPEGSQQTSVKEGDIVIVLSEERMGFIWLKWREIRDWFLLAMSANTTLNTLDQLCR